METQRGRITCKNDDPPPLIKYTFFFQTPPKYVDILYKYCKNLAHALRIQGANFTASNLSKDVYSTITMV